MNKILLLLLLLVSITQSESVEQGIGIAAETNPTAQPLVLTVQVPKDPFVLLSIDWLLNRKISPQQQQSADVAPNPTAQPLVLTESVARSRRKWTKEEDARLTALVEEHGAGDWDMIASMVPGRTYQQCEHRYSCAVNPKIRKGPWTTEEDDMLLEAVKKHGTGDWAMIASMVPGRTRKQCRQKWTNVLSPGIHKGPWTKEENARLTELVNKYGTDDWGKIASMMEGRTDQQCRQRWTNVLRPGIHKGRWTPEEDTMLIELVREHGRKWPIIANMMPGRTYQQCRQRWAALKKNKAELNE